ncbi:MAG: hypothetical protein EZS28_019982, partial [Streblomastix strix]
MVQVKDDALQLLKVDKSELIDAYTKTEDDEMLALKLNISDQIDAYTKQEDDALQLLKVDKSELIEAYTKTEDDEMPALKLNISDQIDAYTKQEDDALLLLNANKSELADYVNLGTAQTITGQKQFNIITVANVSKQGKNDASIFLAGGGDMLVCSLVNQTELEEVQDIASAKWQFKTMLRNLQQVIIYIVGKQVVDYWWDGTDLKLLGTEQSDMANVITILGTATGGGNAISDLSFSENTLISAKNINFVTADYNQNISGSKTFTCIIHSVGIQVQNYDNLSVVLAGGGVKAIQDINASVDLSNYHNKLQTYSQTETDQKLNQKLNISDQIDAYTKTQDDALLLLNADKTELIDSYNKTEVDVLLDDKLNVNDQIDAYTKGEDDALLLMNAEKTQLIDSYNKGETNNLLKNKADSGVSYTKGEADNLLSNQANSGVSYSKYEDDALLSLKANQLTTYIKTESDQLISQIEVEDVDLSGYMTLGTSQTITANKIFNNAYRFVSSIDGMATITGSQFVKSGADDTVVLLGAGGTKPISEFGDGSVDDSNYVKKTGQELQIIHGVLRRDDDELSMSEYDEDYLTRAEIYNAFVSRYDNQTIYGTNTFNSNVNTAGFAKTGKDDTSVLLAGGGDQLLSSCGGVQVDDNKFSCTFYTFMKEIQPKTQINTSTQTIICTVGRPKAGDQVITLGPYIICNRQIPSNTALVLNMTYYKQYESSKKINYDANNDGKIDIMDMWNVNEKGQFETQSNVYETVKKQTDLIESGVQGLNRSNYLNSEIKLIDELAIYKANREEYFNKDGPFITYNFEAKLSQLGANSDTQQTISSGENVRPSK